MERISSVVNLPTAFFMRPVLEPDHGMIFYRSLRSAAKQSRTRLARRIGWLQHLVAFIHQYVEFPKVNFPQFNLPKDPARLSNEDIEHLAGELRNFWHLGDGPLGSIVTLVENNGATVSRDDFLMDEVDALAKWDASADRPFLLLNDNKHSGARSRMDICHEIAHIILHRHLCPEDLSAALHALIEEQANRFAGAFALPARRFAAELELGSLSLDFFQQLKAKNKMSIGSMIVRAGQLGFLNGEQAQRLWMRRTRNGWHVREPLDDELPVEAPHFLPKAMLLMLESKVVTRQTVLSACPFAPNDIEMLTGLSSGSLTEPEVQPKILSFAPRLTKKPE